MADCDEVVEREAVSDDELVAVWDADSVSVDDCVSERESV